MKETLVATGTLKQVDIIARRLYRQSVTVTAQEKPVTKQMLKEIYHWDENLGCIHLDLYVGYFCYMWLDLVPVYMDLVTVT